MHRLRPTTIFTLAHPLLWTAVVTVTAMLIPAPGLTAEDPTLSHRTERLERSHSEQTEEPPISRLLIVGAIEIDAVHRSADESSVDSLDVSTVELGLDTRFSPRSSGHILLLHEEGAAESVVVDEAFITLFSPGTPWSLTAGRFYAPFGDYSSALLSDPLTLSLGETRETALQIGWSSGGSLALAWLANGVTSRGGNDTVDLWGIHLGKTTRLGDRLSIDSGVSWLNNLADSDGLQTAVAQPSALHRHIPGLALHLRLMHGPWKLIMERVSALRRFASADLASGAAGARPLASNLELDLETTVGGRPVTIAVAEQRTREAAATGLPRIVRLAAVTLKIDARSSIGCEWARNSNYLATDDTVLTLRLAASF